MQFNLPLVAELKQFRKLACKLDCIRLHNVLTMSGNLEIPRPITTTKKNNLHSLTTQRNVSTKLHLHSVCVCAQLEAGTDCSWKRSKFGLQHCIDYLYSQPVFLYARARNIPLPFVFSDKTIWPGELHCPETITQHTKTHASLVQWMAVKMLQQQPI